MTSNAQATVEAIRLAAAAIANARAARRGVPAIENILEVLPKNLVAEVIEDATAALVTVPFEVELTRLRKWVDDLQSGLYVNCVYCGHQYGPGETTPVTMAEALKAHVAQCPSRPMAALLKALTAASHALRSYQHGNSTGELAARVADACDQAIAEATGASK